MANRAYLLAVDDRSTTLSKAPAEEIIAEGINEIPVFWAALFAPADRRLDTYEGDEGELKIANWCAETSVAKQRLATLREPIGKLLDDRSGEVWQQFVDHLSALQSKYVKTNGAEVWGLDPEGYEVYWGKLLAAFSEPTPANMKAAVEANDLRYANGAVSWDDDDETTCKLAGADHIRNVPWL
ncbi:MAG: hypothetical protein M3541_23265 [Acidobacteriota bacterium]|nr:hypothetical protein [Acidobacteriota bacterium]